MNPNNTVYSNAASPGAEQPSEHTPTSYDELCKALWQDMLAQLQSTQGEIVVRNEQIADRNDYVYGDKLTKSLDIPVGHDMTSVNWLKRTVEIHKSMFMGRPFQLLSTYDTQDLSMSDDEAEKGRREIANKKEKTYAEERRNLIDGIIRDNGGHSLFADGAESAAAVGSWVLKAYYDTDEDKYVLAPVEAVENCYVVWERNDFRKHRLFAYVHQVDKVIAISEYGANEDVATSPEGSPLGVVGSNITNKQPGQPMVSIFEATGIVPGWCAKGARVAKCELGKESKMNLQFVGNQLKGVISDEKKLPKYYVLPNKKVRRQAWGISDITDSAININCTYIETFSDWRTVSNKVNFPKFKFFNFGPDVQMPKFKSRTVQGLPLAEDQDIVLLPTGDANRIDFQAQLDELKEQFVRETGISRVLFDDPSVTLNSNQALLTSMKPTSDIAENKKQLWAPILVEIFTDAIEVVAAHKPEFKDLADGSFSLKVQWPSVMQKEDPVYQQMLLNRWNAGTISFQSYLEQQGETKEEIDRMRDEFADPVTAAALGKALGPLAQYVMGLPGSQAEMGGAPAVATPANNTPGAGPVSQPGSGATPVSPEGALARTNQNSGG